jgi:hypothetical protein
MKNNGKPWRNIEFLLSLQKQPVGGNDLIDLTFSPLLYLSAGVAI